MVTAEDKIKAFDLVKELKVNVWTEIVACESYDDYLETLKTYSHLLDSMTLSLYSWKFLKRVFSDEVEE